MDENGDSVGAEGFTKPEGPAVQTPGGGTGPTAVHRRRKWLWMVVVFVGMVTAVVWPRKPEGPPQIITIPNGDKYEFMGVTYGTNHVMGSVAARLVSHLPGGMTNWVQKHFGNKIGPIRTFYTPSPGLCVWFKLLETNGVPIRNSPRIYAKLADENDVEGGEQYVQQFLPRLPNTVYPLGVFFVAPRRSHVLQLCFYNTDRSGNISNEIARVRFPNPLYGRFPAWQSEPLPTTKKAGDLDVRLDHIMTGVRYVRPVDGYKAIEYRPSQRGEHTEAVFDVALNSSSGTNESWTIQNVTLSDSTGNLLQQLGLPRELIPDPNAEKFVLTPIPGNGEVRGFLEGTLWRDEPAWRLQVDFKRSSQFAAEELTTFKNVPLPKIGTTNKNVMTNIVAGMQVVLAEFQRYPGNTQRSARIQIELPEKPASVAVDFAKIATDTGKEINIQYSSWGLFSRVTYLATIPTDAQSVDIALVVQRMRSVEFFVKPPAY
jgi:hypothetical protein